MTEDLHEEQAEMRQALADLHAASDDDQREVARMLHGVLDSLPQGSGLSSALRAVAVGIDARLGPAPATQ